MQMKSFSFTTKDGVEHWINRWAPDTEEEIKGVVQLHHGLSEHSLRYDRFGSILAENGYVLNAYDMRGHGKTAELAEKKGNGCTGMLAEKDGFQRVIDDLDEIIEAVKAEYPDKPVYLFGHSFGSFVSQGYIIQHSEKLSGCILCGSAGPRRALIGFGSVAVNLVALFKGSKKYSKLLEYLSFGSYNNRVPELKTRNGWLTRDDMVVQMYNEDKWCGIPLRISFYKDMMAGLKYIHKKENMKKISNDLPVYIIYGTDDPVGSYGKTVENLYNIYKANGIKNIEKTAYEGGRHEILNETNKEQVENDILSWLAKN